MIDPHLRDSALRRLVFWALVSVTVFNAVSAIGGGVAILATDGLGMPMSMLASWRRGPSRRSPGLQ
ncbi:hypothetical protein [Agromyces bauzanensis]|uniref:Uncharacterized protein n=1 Tax=Agromyces bauzanensis TaxID=1308924 RepID=A0A917UU66_9MICO|nr:hypothetical protein [Agromyces bauzanensis]GGJ85392.1 hypothetical protein GCM10011372_24590 [Agromyces bauzanensis]